MECNNTTISSFDLWTSENAHDIFAFVIKKLRVDWQPKHIVNVGLFEVTKLLINPWEKKINRIVGCIWVEEGEI